MSAQRAAADDFPRKADFSIPKGITYLNSAYTHPMPNAVGAAIRSHIARRSEPGPTIGEGSASLVRQVTDDFAALINASPSEIAFIPNTSTGENLITNGLGITRFDGNVVTDAYHFDGSLLHLKELARQGLDLRVVMPRDNRIDLADMERVVDGKTKLIQLSLVSMYAGFQHDLKKVCDLAHAHGAHVYADITQAVGAVPIDVRASGVDFCACSSFKWLMADFGLGFLYARSELLDTVFTRPQWGYHSATDVDVHYPPFDPGPTPIGWTLKNDAAGHFEVGSHALGSLAALGAALPYVRQLGVDKIEAWRQPLLRKLESEMPRRGFTPASPAGSTSPIMTFAARDTTRAQQQLERARVNVRVAPYWLRFSPSVFNDMADVDRALEALS